MDTLLGLIGVVLWVVGTISLAAAVTFLVVKVLPGGDKPEQPADGAQATGS
jgi:hypothetical protein